MYCPKCGKENPEKQKFCTACGFKLEAIAEAMTKESPTSAERTIEILRGGQKSWRAPLTYAFVLIAAGIVIGAVGHKVLDDKTLGDIGILIALVGVFVMFLKGILLAVPIPNTASPRPETLVDRERESQAPAPVQPRDPVGLLSAEPPSITEHTTQQLEPSLASPEERPRTTQPTLQ